MEKDCSVTLADPRIRAQESDGDGSAGGNKDRTTEAGWLDNIQKLLVAERIARGGSTSPG